MSESGNGNEAFRWSSAGGMVGLGSLGGNGGGQSLAVTPDGSVIVGTAETSVDWWPFYWTQAGGMQHISNISEMVGGRAEAVSDDGEWIVGFAATPTIQHAFRSRIGGNTHR
ncbi:MAG: putative membrane protein [Planctomycetota bacterium]|jgi:uncharacterized membrane protein